MADINGHLVPIFIIYADGARLDTEHEGAVRRIRVSDRLDGIGRCVIEFGHPAAALLERGAIVPESAVDVHLGYKDDCGKVFGGEVTGFEHGYSEHGGQVLYVTVSGRLHRLRNAVRSESYERKTAGGFVAEMLDRYGLKADVEDFGPETEVSVHHLESDWDFLMEHAKRYGRSVYEQDGTVYVKNEITVSQDDIVLEFGKSIISFRVKESLAAQISKCTYTGWNMLKAEGITGSAEIGEVSVKAGGGTSWADEARILPGMWESVIDSQEVKDSEDARNRALGELQNASMEWQRAEVRCEGDHRIRPGMRVTLKYVGERFSGEYVAERVEHEFGIDGFITEVQLRRNMLPGEPKRPSAIDEERERNMRNQICNMNAGRQNETDARVAMFHIGKNMDGAEFVFSEEEIVSVDSSEETATQSAFLVKSEENTIDDFESSSNRIEGYYYFIKNCLNIEKSETRYSKNLNILIKDLNMKLASLFRTYGYRENRGSRNKIVSYSFYIKGMKTVVAYVVTAPNYGYSEKAKSISEGISSIFGIDSFIYIRDR